MTHHRRAQSTAKWIVGAAIAGVASVALIVAAWRYWRPVVTVTEPVEGPVVHAFYSTGTVEPDKEYPIMSNIAGVLSEVRVDKGDRVRQGDVLAVVTEPELIYQAQKARAELDEKRKLAADESPVLEEFDKRIEATEALLAIGEREQNRITGLLERNAASSTDLDRAMDRVKTLWSEREALKAQRATRRIELQREVEVATAALAIAEWNLEQQTIKSPVDGAVLDRPATVGTRLAVNGHVMRIANVEPANLVMRAAVDEEDKNKVDVGQTVRMTLYSFPGEAFTGKVARIYDQADLQRRTFEIDVKLDDPSIRLAPGMTGELAFIIAEKPVANVIPSQAVQAGQVWVVRRGQLAKASVEIGLTSVERTEIINGLNPTDKVVISPIGNLTEGTTVGTTFVDPRTAAALNRTAERTDNFKGFE